MTTHDIRDIVATLDNVDQVVDHASPTDCTITIRYEVAYGVYMAVTVSFASVQWNPGRSDSGHISQWLNPPEAEGWEIEGGEVTSISFGIFSGDPVFYPVAGLAAPMAHALVRIAKHHIETEDAP